MRINHNIASLNTYRQLTSNGAATNKSLEKLSSGLRINRAGDDAAGLAISEKMRGQIRGLDQASRNAQDGISMIQTAEGAMNESQSILQRMRELAVQSANDTNTNADRTEIQKEVGALRTEFDRIANQTEFNTKKLLDGSMATKLDTNVTNSDILADGQFDSLSYTGLSAGSWVLTSQADNSYILSNGAGINLSSTVPAAGTAGTIQFGGPNGESVSINVNASYGADGLNGLKFAVTGSQIQLQIGANTNQAMGVTIGDMRITGGTDATITALSAVNVATQTGANTAVATLDTALATVSSKRADLGAYQNRLEHTINNLNTSSENLTASESRVRDVDMAKEMMEFTKNNILSQAAQAMLAQANQQPQGVLQLLR